MGFLTDLFGGTDEDAVPKVPLYSQQTQDVAPWQMPFWNEFVRQGTTVAGSQFQPISGADYVADFSPDTLAAWDQLRQMEGGYEPGIGMARQYAAAGGGGFDPGEFAKYESATTGGVLDELARRASRNFMEDVLPDIQDRFILSGQTEAGGSTRERDITAQMAGRANEALLGEQRAALDAANKRAMDAYLTGQQQRLTGASTIGAIEGQAQTLGQRQATARAAAGAEQEARRQAALDINRGEAVAARDYPFKVMGALSQAGGTLPRVGSTTGMQEKNVSQQDAEVPGMIPQAIGIGTGILGSIGDIFGFRHGGRARGTMDMMARYAAGGRARRPLIEGSRREQEMDRMMARRMGIPMSRWEGSPEDMRHDRMMRVMPRRGALDMMAYADGGRAKIGKVMGEFKRGELRSGSSKGPVVRDRKQALAIALAESRRKAA